MGINEEMLRYKNTPMRQL